MIYTENGHHAKMVIMTNKNEDECDAPYDEKFDSFLNCHEKKIDWKMCGPDIYSEDAPGDLPSCSLRKKKRTDEIRIK